MSKLIKISPDQVPAHMITAGMLAHNIINGIVPSMTSNANKVLGINSGATGTEWKSVVASTGITVTHASGTITITATGGVAPAAHASTHLYSGADPLALTSASVFVGNASNYAQGRALSGDVTIDNTGVTTIGALKVTNAMLAGSIAYSKLVLTGAILNADLAGSIAYSKLVLTGAILNADLAGSIAYSKLVLTGAILNADLAGSIAASKLVGTDIATVGTITSGVWNAGAVTSSGALVGTSLNVGSGTITSGAITASGIINTYGDNRYLEIKNTLAGSGGAPSYSGIQFVVSSGGTAGIIEVGDQLNSNSNSDMRFKTRATGGGNAYVSMILGGNGALTLGQVAGTGIGDFYSGAITASGTGTFLTGGNGVNIIGNIGGPAYISFDQSVNNGGKRWRVGHTGGIAGFTTFDIYNQTDGITAMTLSPTGAATFISTIYSGAITISGTITSTTGNFTTSASTLTIWNSATAGRLNLQAKDRVRIGRYVDDVEMFGVDNATGNAIFAGAVTASGLVTANAGAVVSWTGGTGLTLNRVDGSGFLWLNKSNGVNGVFLGTNGSGQIEAYTGSANALAFTIDASNATFSGDVGIIKSTANLYLKDTSTGFQSASTTVVTLQSSNALRSTSFTSGLVGWGINAGGDAEFANITARGAIRTSIFLYNSIQTTGGTLGTFKSAGKLRADVTITAAPTYGTTAFNVDIDDKDGITHASAKTFANGDIIRLKDGLVGDTWLRVDSASDQTTFWRYSCTVMAGSANVTYSKGLGVPDYGASGDGFIIQTADATDAPYMQMATHDATMTSSDSSGTLNVTPKMRTGNLNGSYGYATNIFGFAVGEYGAASKVSITVDPTNGYRVINNTTVVGQWDNSGGITVGEVGASKSNVQITSGALNFRTNTTTMMSLSSAGAITVGEVGATKPNIYIDSANMYLRVNTTANITLDATGITVGEVGASKSNVQITSGTVKLRTNTTDIITLDTSGVVTIGQVAASKANVYISAATTKFRINTTTYLEITSSGTITNDSAAIQIAADLSLGAGYDFTILHSNAINSAQMYVDTSDHFLINFSKGIVGSNITYVLYTSDQETTASGAVAAAKEFQESASNDKIRLVYRHRDGNKRIRASAKIKESAGDLVRMRIYVNAAAGSNGDVTNVAYEDATSTYDVTGLTPGNVYEVKVWLSDVNVAGTAYMKQVVVDVESTT